MAVAVTLAFLGAARAEFYTGNKLHDLCTSSKSIAMGYAVGILDDAELVDLEGKQFCVPAGVTAGQVVDVVCNYLRNNPAERHYSASLIARVAIVAAWKCPSSKGDKR